MSVIDDALVANAAYARNFKLGGLQMPPARKLAIVACMDARLTVEQMLGLKTGDAHIIRNAGGIVTGDAIRSLIISHHLLGTQEFMIINHADCGMLTFQDADLLKRLENETGTSTVGPAVFYAFKNPEANVRQQMEKLRSHPWVPKQIAIRGFVYNEKDGKLTEVKAAARAGRS
jgi:carbonic anhydrase